MRRFLLSVGFLIFLAALSTAFGWNYLERQFSAPGPLQELRIVFIEKGAGTRQIAAQLEEAGVIESAFLFRVGVRIFDRAKSLRAGEYSFQPGASVNDVLEKIISGKTIVHRLTIPEGATSQEVLLEIEALTTLTGPLPSLPLEGTVLPETYHFSRGDSREELLKRMSDAMAEVARELWETRTEGLPFGSLEEAIILASIVEKETAVAAERGLVAGVFINRLRKGMRLQSDPTVVYGITLGKAPLGRALRRSDLRQDTPYNTYLVDGLPPGPIANPGRESLEAVLNPADTKFLYFVADGSGGHAFAVTLDEHNRNVVQWRKIERARDAAAN